MTMVWFVEIEIRTSTRMCDTNTYNILEKCFHLLESELIPNICQNNKHEQILNQNAIAFLHLFKSLTENIIVFFCQCAGITYCLSLKRSYQSLSNLSLCS